MKNEREAELSEKLKVRSFPRQDKNEKLAWNRDNWSIYN